MTAIEPVLESRSKTAEDTLLIDTDVHESWSSMNDIKPFMDPFWAKQHDLYKFAPSPGFHYMAPVQHGGTRKEWETGGSMGSSLEAMQKHLLDGESTSVGILDGALPTFAAIKGSQEFMTAVVSAYNDWQIATWLEPEPRLRGSVHVMLHDPERAVEEIERVGKHPQIVQVFFPTLTDTQFGDPFYRPIFEAAVRNELAVAMHHIGSTDTVLGWPRYYVEWHTTCAPFSNMAQLVSLVFNGTFERFPELKVVVLEAGIAWLPWLLWRLDEQYREHRAEVPWLKRLPSEYLSDQVRVAPQPLGDLNARQVQQVVELAQGEDMLVFASDYPHYDADSAYAVLPNTLPEELRRKIRFENALATYPKLRNLSAA